VIPAAPPIQGYVRPGRQRRQAFRSRRVQWRSTVPPLHRALQYKRLIEHPRSVPHHRHPRSPSVSARLCRRERSLSRRVPGRLAGNAPRPYPRTSGFRPLPLSPQPGPWDSARQGQGDGADCQPPEWARSPETPSAVNAPTKPWLRPWSAHRRPGEHTPRHGDLLSQAEPVRTGRARAGRRMAERRTRAIPAAEPYRLTGRSVRAGVPGCKLPPGGGTPTPAPPQPPACLSVDSEDRPGSSGAEELSPPGASQGWRMMAPMDRASRLVGDCGRQIRRGGIPALPRLPHRTSR